MWALARHAVRFEFHIYCSLLRLVTRRPSLQAGTRPFGYGRMVTPVLALWIFASAAEVPLLHLLLPWRTAQVISLILGAWGLAWMLGMLGNFRRYPHLLGATTLRVRNGPGTTIEVPLSAIEAVAVAERDLPSSVRTLQLQDTDRGLHLNVVVSARVNVHLTMKGPTPVKTPRGPMSPAVISLLADDPQELMKAIRAAL